MKHRMQRSLNDLEMHGKNSRFVGGRDGIGLQTLKHQQVLRILAQRKPELGRQRGTAEPPPHREGMRAVDRFQGE